MSTAIIGTLPLIGAALVIGVVGLARGVGPRWWAALTRDDPDGLDPHQIARALVDHARRVGIARGLGYRVEARGQHFLVAQEGHEDHTYTSAPQAIEAIERRIRSGR